MYNIYNLKNIKSENKKPLAIQEESIKNIPNNKI